MCRGFLLKSSSPQSNVIISIIPNPGTVKLEDKEIQINFLMDGVIS